MNNEQLKTSLGIDFLSDEIDGVIHDLNNTIRHAAQSLTLGEKAQAAANLGATSAATVNTLVLRGSEGQSSFTSSNEDAVNASSDTGIAIYGFSQSGTGVSGFSATGKHADFGDGKVIIDNNGDTTFTGKVISPNLLRHDTAQSLTSDQKTQARANIEATRLPQELGYAPLNAAETGLVIPDVELQTGVSAPFYLDTPYFIPQVTSDYYGDDQWEVYPDGGNWIFYYTEHGAVWTGAPAANAVDSELVVGDGGNSFGNFQPEVVTRPKTTGTLATYNGRLYANHGTDDLPDWQEVVVPAEISNFVTRTGASQTVSSPKVFSGANLHSGPNIFTQPVTATNPATAASHLLDRATADARYGQTIAAVTTESVAITSSDTLQDHLEIIIPTTGTWKMESRVMMAGTQNNGKIAQTGMGNILDTGIRRTALTTAISNVTSGISANNFMGYESIFNVTSAPHTVKIQIAQNTFSATASTFRRGNYLIAQKIG